MSAYIKIPLAFLAAGAIVLLTFAALLIGAYYYVSPTLPAAAELRDLKMKIPLRVFSRDGRLIQEFGQEKRTPVAYEEIPKLLVDAVLAAEDEHFFEHPGVDYRGVLRAAFNELTSADRGIGGSTLTQQVARTTNLVGRERRNALAAYVRKFKEWILALRIEREFTKEEILELYLNTNAFSHSAFGVVTAAQIYFGKDLNDLTVSEAAILAGIPNGPSIWNPISSPQGATTRRAYVLRRMVETGAIDAQQYEQALAEPVLGKRYGAQIEVQAPYVAEMVRAEMVRRFGPEAAYEAGLRVTTTIDSRLQNATNNSIRRTLVAYDERHGYRGPLARVDLTDVDVTVATLESEEHVRELIADYGDLLGYETGLVLEVDDTGASVYFRGRGRQRIELPAVEWAAPFINDDTTGAKPATVAEVLNPGDVVRFRPDENGNLRLGQIPEVQGAFVSLDPQDGAVAALAGGLDFYLNNFNRATQARRQPGSAFKPFVYSAALEHGFNAASIINDSPPNIGYDPVLERVWRPENFGKYYGPVRLRFALAESLNAASVRTMQQVGISTTVEHVRRFGFDDRAVPSDLSLALGSGDVAPLNLARGFAAFANGGHRVETYFIDRVEDANGEVLYESMPTFVCREGPRRAAPSEYSYQIVEPVTGCETAQTRADGSPAEQALISDVTELYPPMRLAPRVVSAQNAYLISDMLQGVISQGTGVRARRELGRNDLAGKTGTTNDGVDTWFVGFSADVVAAAWVGFDMSRPLGGAEQGGRTALPMWIGYMAEALEGVPETPFRVPPGIIEHRINPQSGLIASDANRTAVLEKFEIGRVPEREPDPVYTRHFDPAEPGQPTGTSEPIF